MTAIGLRRNSQLMMQRVFQRRRSWNWRVGREQQGKLEIMLRLKYLRFLIFSANLLSQDNVYQESKSTRKQVIGEDLRDRLAKIVKNVSKKFDPKVSVIGTKNYSLKKLQEKDGNRLIGESIRKGSQFPFKQTMMAENTIKNTEEVPEESFLQEFTFNPNNQDTSVKASNELSPHKDPFDVLAVSKRRRDVEAPRLI